MGLFRELQRRNVIRVGLAYLAASWLLVQVLDIIAEAWDAPALFMRLAITALGLGLPVVLLFAWAYELTPEGLRRETEVDRSASETRQTGRRLDRVIIVLLVVALGYFAVDRFLLPPSPVSESVELTETAGPGSAESARNDRALPLPDDRSVAVMPLEAIGQDSAGLTLATGIHSGLVTELARISSLRVVSRASAESVADRGLTLRQTAGLLNVANILSGDVQRSGAKVRVSLQLVDAATDAYLWAENFDRELTADTVFAIQDEIARAVADALEASLTEAEEARLGRLPTQDIEALELFYRGMALLEQRGDENLRAARALFRQAREQDPAFARALAAEAQAILLNILGYNLGTLPRQEAVAEARPLVERALDLAPDDDMALAAMGNLLKYEFRNVEAMEWFRRALAANPTNGDVINWLRSQSMLVGEWAQDRELALRAAQVDPASRVALANAAAVQALHPDGDPDDAARLLQRLERIDPAWAWLARGDIARLGGELVEAIRCYQEALLLDPEIASAREYAAVLLADWGLAEEAMAVDSSFSEFYVPWRSGDLPRALAIAQRQFEANPQDTDAVANLARALHSAGRWDEALRLGLIVWESMGRNPHAWPPQGLADMAWGGRITERPAVRDEFVKMTQENLDAFRQSGTRLRGAEIAAAKLAALEGRLAEGVAHVTAAIDLGYRDQRDLEGATLAPLADHFGFQAQVNRLDRLVAEERAQALEIVCGPGGLLAGQQSPAGVCEPS